MESKTFFSIFLHWFQHKPREIRSLIFVSNIHVFTKNMGSVLFWGCGRDLCTVVYTVHTVYSIKAYKFRSKLMKFSNLEDDFGCLFFYIDIYSMAGIQWIESRRWNWIVSLNIFMIRLLLAGEHTHDKLWSYMQVSSLQNINQ